MRVVSLSITGSQIRDQWVSVGSAATPASAVYLMKFQPADQTESCCNPDQKKEQQWYSRMSRSSEWSRGHSAVQHHPEKFLAVAAVKRDRRPRRRTDPRSSDLLPTPATVGHSGRHQVSKEEPSVIRRDGRVSVCIEPYYDR